MNSNPLSEQNLQEMMEKYRQEMLQLRRRSTLPAETGEPAESSAGDMGIGTEPENTPEFVPPIPMPLVTDMPETEPAPPVDTRSRTAPLPFTPPETVDDLPPPRQNPPAVTEEPEEPEYYMPGEEMPANDLAEPEGDIDAQLREEMIEGRRPGGENEMDITGNAPNLIPVETTYPPENDLATLQVRVYTARGAIPIQNAVVTITGKNPDNDLQYVTITDANGFSPPVVLPATDRKLTLQPAENIPVTTYDVLVVAPGYFRVRNRNVPVYGGTSAIQPVELIPLPEMVDGGEEQTFYGSSPQDL